MGAHHLIDRFADTLAGLARQNFFHAPARRSQVQVRGLRPLIVEDHVLCIEAQKRIRKRIEDGLQLLRRLHHFLFGSRALGNIDGCETDPCDSLVAIHQAMLVNVCDHQPAVRAGVLIPPGRIGVGRQLGRKRLTRHLLVVTILKFPIRFPDNLLFWQSTQDALALVYPLDDAFPIDL